MFWTPRPADTRFRRGGLRAALAICLGAAAGMCAAAQASDVPAQDAPGVVAEVRDGRLSLQAEGASLAAVLRAIGKAGSFGVRLRGEFAEPVRQSFTDQPLEDAIRRLVGAHSLIVMRGSGKSDETATGIAEIRVTAKSGTTAGAAAERTASPSPPEPAPDDEVDPAAQEDSYRQAVLEYMPPTKDDLLLDLAEPDHAARVAALPRVGSLPPRDAIEVISHVFTNDEDVTVRSRGVAALTRLDGAAARSLLRERALKDQDPGLRGQALNALASSRGERAINVIGRALRQDPEPEVRMGAIRALGRVGGEWARHALERAARDFDPEISFAAEQTLAAWPDED